MAVKTVHTVFLSDLHLGSPHAQPGLLLEFLQSIDPQRLILNGDILEGWKLRDPEFRTLNESEKSVLDMIFWLADSGVEITWLTGNHDDCMDAYIFSGNFQPLANISFQKEHVIEIKDGRYLVAHGDRYDPRDSKFILNEGNLKQTYSDITSYDAQSTLYETSYFHVALEALYEATLKLNAAIIKTSMALTGKHYSLFAKIKSDRPGGIIDTFKTATIEAVRRRGFDGVICGHIHYPQCDGNYYNSGSFLEEASALILNEDEEISLCDWAVTRHDYGFSGAPRQKLPKRHPARAYRAQTKKFLASLYENVWPRVCPQTDVTLHDLEDRNVA